MSKRNVRMKNAVKYGLLFFGGLILIGFALKGNITHEKFDSEKWKNWTESVSESDWSLRWDMMNSLRNIYELKGKTKAEIINLLGEPEWTEDSHFSYNLGPSKHGINMGYLRIKFSKTDIVTDIIVGDG